MRASVLVTVVILITFVTGSVFSEEVLTNESVIRMHNAGLPASVIIAKIETSQTAFDTSVDALVDMAGKGLPDEFISAMTKAGVSSEEGDSQGWVGQSGSVTLGSFPTAQPKAATQFNNSIRPNPGIFLETEDGSLHEIEPPAYSGSKSAGVWKSALTYGIASSKSKAMLQGLKAHTRVQGRSPSFFFCFEESEAGLSYETYGATTPTQFQLVELDVKPKQNARLFVTGKFNYMSGGYAGPPPNYRRDFSYEKTAPGIYKVTAAGLSPGEYAFFFSGSASTAMAMTYGLVSTTGGGKVIDFGVR